MYAVVLSYVSGLSTRGIFPMGNKNNYDNNNNHNNHNNKNNDYDNL